MSMRKLTGKAAILAAAIAASAAIPMTANAASSITINSVQQRWPWNNKVDITYTVTNGQHRATGIYAKVDFAITIPGWGTRNVPGNTIGASAEGGPDGETHTVTWTAPEGYKTTECTVVATLSSSDIPSGNDYMIVDLSTGDVTYEGLMQTQELSNSRYNSDDTYKTGSKMVLRKIPKWSDASTLPNHASKLSTLSGYPTGHSAFGYNSPKQWRTDKDYYIGIFKVTSKQYRIVRGETGGDANSCYSVNYATWRNGDTTTSAIVANQNGTFFQRLNYKTGLYFDMPTELMHEIAARAGETAKYIWGEETITQNVATNYMRCTENRNDGNTQKQAKYVVGTLAANNWGLYDMQGIGFDLVRGNCSSSNFQDDDLADRKDPFEVKEENGSDMRGRGGPRVFDSYTDPYSAASNRAGNRTSGAFGYNCRVAYIVE